MSTCSFCIFSGRQINDWVTKPVISSIFWLKRGSFATSGTRIGSPAFFVQRG